VIFLANGEDLARQKKRMRRSVRIRIRVVLIRHRKIDSDPVAIAKEVKQDFNGIASD
jgi:hypothetical protein